MTSTYWHTLRRLIVKADDRVHMEPMMGTLYVPLRDGADLYATPGWEDESLPWTVWDCESDARCLSGNRPVQWTGRLRDDLRLYVAQLDDLLNDHTE